MSGRENEYNNDETIEDGIMDEYINHENRMNGRTNE